jgi:hypothetical protein
MHTVVAAKVHVPKDAHEIAVDQLSNTVRSATHAICVTDETATR